MAVKISFVNDWGGSITSVLESLRYYTPGHDCRWNDLFGVQNPEEADYLVVLNGLPRYRTGGGWPRVLRAVKQALQNFWIKRTSPAWRHPRKIYLQTEPPEIRKPRIDPSDCIYYGSYEHHHHISNWHLRVPFMELKNLKLPEHDRRLSAIVSGKAKTAAQKQRVEIVRQVCKRYPDMDVFGRGLEPSDFGSAYKGPLEYNQHCKFRGLYGYRYSLAFENSSHENYFTEKLIDCFLCWSKPIYWGCPNILKYFPEESLARVDLFDPDAPGVIADELQKPVNDEAIREARELVMNKYNIWPSIEQIIATYESS